MLSLVLQSSRFAVLAALFMRIQIIWDVTVCHWVGGSLHFKAFVMPSLSRVKRSEKNAKIRVGVFFLDLFTLEDEGTTTLCNVGTAHPAAHHIFWFYTHVPADCQSFYSTVLQMEELFVMVMKLHTAVSWRYSKLFVPLQDMCSNVCLTSEAHLRYVASKLKISEWLNLL